MFPQVIESERIRHEQLCHANIDVQEFYWVCAYDDGIEEITRYMPWTPHETMRESKKFIDQTERKWEDGESLKYILRPKASEDGAGEFAGLTGLKFKWDRRTAVQWIWLRKRFWGRSYNGESAHSLMELVFEELDLDLFAVTHAVENTKSQQAIQRYIEAAGGQRDGLLRNWVPHEDYVSDEVRYTVSQEQWRATRESTEE
ncbi:GNAT family N-acetyltransferase [Haloferax profundi]|uniref:Acetyltransferase n=1 Tax=Haloferax profundi TaxID=1544718 RepID=A0A0W1RJP2_9EURY|nr:GNAT family protein [Haloferax profundi]KTG13709.1 acetyltransferase [Haloferax profundi]